jgi:hypothetical protein
VTAVKETRPEAGSDVVQVKVWDFPVRILHWTLVACIIVLSLAGFYIIDPFFGSSSPSGFTMGIVRFVHITALEAVTGFALEALVNPHGLMWDLTGWAAGTSARGSSPASAPHAAGADSSPPRPPT